MPVVSNWGVTHMNCSVMPNTLTINYTLNPGLPNFSVVDVYGRSLLGSIQIQCTDQVCKEIEQSLHIIEYYILQGKTHQLDVNCSIDANSITFDDEISKINGQFMISNLSEAGISPGSVCSVVDGCYKYQVDGEPPHHVLIPEANCTIPGETVAILACTGSYK